MPFDSANWPPREEDSARTPNDIDIVLFCISIAAPVLCFAYCIIAAQAAIDGQFVIAILQTIAALACYSAGEHAIKNEPN